MTATRDAARPPVPGELLFARYAYPPNALGYCGPDEPERLLDYATAAREGAGLARLARQFDGAWPYLELVAVANGIEDPLDRRVVEAYWVGNGLLDRIAPSQLGLLLDGRFGRELRWAQVTGAVPTGALPHHSFHVLCVYPWLGLLRAGRGSEPLRVLDRCRVRWGRVERVQGDRVAVSCRPLVWDGRVLALGPPRPEWVVAAAAGRGFAGPLRPGDWVAMHWDWVCDRLTGDQLSRLRHYTSTQLAVANGAAPPPARAAA